MMKHFLLGAVASLALAGAAQAQTFDVNFSGGGVTGTGEVSAPIDEGGGVFQATSGFFNITVGSLNLTLQLDPVTPPETTVTLHDIVNANGDLFGDNLIGSNFVDSTGLLFALPAASGDVNGFNGDVVNLWGNGGDSYTLAFGGPDFPAGINQVNGTATVESVPEPSAWAMGIAALALIGVLRRRAQQA